MLGLSLQSAIAPTTEAAWLLTVLLGLILAADLYRDVTRLVTARNVVLVGIFAWYLLEALQLPEQVQAYGRDATDYALIIVGLAMWCFLYGYRIGRVHLFDAIGTRLVRLRDRNLQWRVLLLGAAIGFVPVIVYGGSDPQALIQDILGMRQTWGGQLGRGALGDFRAAVLMLETCVLGVSWLAILFLLDRRNPPGARLFALFLCSWTLLRAYGSGTRSSLLAAIAVPCAAVFWLSPPRWRRRMVFAAPVLAVAFYFFAGAMVSGRGYARLEFGQQPNYVGHEMFRELLYIADVVPSEHPHLLGTTYWAQLINPIPRFLWPSKPLGFGVEYAAWHGYDALAGGPNMAPGIIGEMYANFGILGVVICSFIGGFLCRAWDFLRERHPESPPVLVFHSAGLVALFLFGRSVAVSCLYPLIALYLLTVLVLGRHRRPAARRRGATGSLHVAAHASGLPRHPESQPN